MICTIWQPAYKPPGFSRIEHVEVVKLRTSERILAHLAAHGPTARHILLQKLGITNSVFRHAAAEIQDDVEFEQSGSGVTRVSMYWLAGHPPAPELRSESHKLYVWFSENPWSRATEIPAGVYTGRDKHCCVHFLEKQNRIVSRMSDGHKQYRAAA